MGVQFTKKRNQKSIVPFFLELYFWGVQFTQKNKNKKYISSSKIFGTIFFGAQFTKKEIKKNIVPFFFGTIFFLGWGPFHEKGMQKNIVPKHLELFF